jgi:hypothetical protein
MPGLTERVTRSHYEWDRHLTSVSVSVTYAANQSRSSKGRVAEASRQVGRVRFPRADLHSAPGRLRVINARPALRPVCGVKPAALGRQGAGNARS